MLHLHFSNRYEALVERFLAVRSLAPRGPLARESIIVPSVGVRRALTLAIADAQGLCTNVEFDFLARWLWRQIARIVPGIADESPFAPDVLTWRVHVALGDPAFLHDHPRLSNYLGTADDLMRHELARRIAALLEQYVTYRPDWLAAWQQGREAAIATDDATQHADARWQAALWQRLTAELELGALHPVSTFVERLREGGARAALAAGLPPCVHLFALPTLPPLHVDLLSHLGQAIDLHLYVLNPCSEYWFELIDRRRLSHLSTQGDAGTHEEGHRLLAAWGKQTQSHIDLLVDRFGDGVDDDSRFEPHADATLLAHVHNTILALEPIEPGSVVLAPDDRSIEIHACHSIKRELEVLHDHLLGLFSGDASAALPALGPADILVVTPDLEAAAPLIDAIFGTAPKDRFIPYTVTGRARSGVNAPARALLALLALAGSRFEATAVYGVLQQEIVARRFGLDRDALVQVHEAMREAGIHWALDAEHRARFDVPPLALHTLADGLDRLFLGYALPSQVDQPFGLLLPAGDTQGTSALVLGAFARYVHALQRLQQTVAMPQTPAAWASVLLEAADTFTAAAGNELDDLRELQDQIRTLVDAMARGGVTHPVPLPVVRAALEQALDDPARGGVPSGGVTFTSMSSLRNLPYAVVCAIGLNDGAFPTSSRPAEFDLMALHPRRGDRQRRADERNVFLDLLLAARRSLYLSYCGHSVRDNAPLPPSVLVAELLDVLLPAIATDPADPRSIEHARRRIVVQHPLQPFSPEAFAPGGDARVRSFNRELCEALRQSLRTAPERARGKPAGAPTGSADAPHRDEGLADDAGAGESDENDVSDDGRVAPFFVLPLAEPDAAWHDVTLAQLVEFFRNPCRYLLRHRLHIDLPRDPEELVDDEPFVPDRRDRAALARRLLPRLLAGDDAGQVRRLAEAGVELAAGALGAQVLDAELAEMTAFAARVRAATAAPCVPPHQTTIEMRLDGAPWRLRAGFADLRASGLVRWRFDELRAGDALESWLHHLVLCAEPPSGVASSSQWIAIGARHAWRTPERPREILDTLLRIYRDGLSRPVHFFPRSAWAYASNSQSLSQARARWRGREGVSVGESADAGYRLALRGQPDPIDGAEFAALAQAVFGPLLEHLDEPA